MKLSLLAEQTNSTIEQGLPDLEISSTAGLDLAGEGDVTFLANPKYTPQIAGTGLTFSYKWSRNSEDGTTVIAAATLATYLLRRPDSGISVSCVPWRTT